ncbi:MAG: biopolymer transporter ExbD [Bdellovibrio sp.]|nr:MAG: biopolymer transporter ExbD [Bdellovibrio sp.]
MAHIDDGGNSGREVSVDVNLVPFIDLMSVLVIFLLVTAVWSQVSMIQIGSSVYGKRTSSEVAKPEPKVYVPFRLDIKPDQFRVLIGRQLISIPKVRGEYNTRRLLKELKKIKELYPEKEDAIVSVSDQLPYKTLILGMDALLESGFPKISIATAEVQ